MAEGGRVELRVQNLDGEHDAAAIRRGLASAPGLYDVRVYPKAAKVALTFDPGKTSAGTLLSHLEALGFPVAPNLDDLRPPVPWKNAKVLAAAGSALLLLCGWFVSLAGGPTPYSIVLYYGAMLGAGWFFGRRALGELIHMRRIGASLLMLVASLTAAAMGLPGEGAVVMVLYSIADAVKVYTEARLRSTVGILMRLAPKTALVRRDDGVKSVAASELRIGDVFIVGPGQSVATDGDVVAGESRVDEAAVTGDRMPVAKVPGDAVLAGTINGPAPLEVCVTKPAAENTVAEMIRLLEEAQESKGTAQRSVDRFVERYNPAILAAGIALAMLSPVVLGGSWFGWLYRATVFIVAAVPCALVISIPVTLVAALGAAARRGMVVNGAVHMEALARASVFAFDNGTITRGEPEVTDVVLPASRGPLAADESALIALAAGLNASSEHPVGRALSRYAQARGIAPTVVEDIRVLPGRGISARLASQPEVTAYLCSPQLFVSKTGTDFSEVQAHIDRLQWDGKSVAVIGTAEMLLGVIAVKEPIRPNAAHAIHILKQGRRSMRRAVLLSSDEEAVARSVASHVGFDEAFAGLTQDGKIVKIREIASQHGHVAIVSDGINDAPVLAEACVGIAIGAARTYIAPDTAHVVLMSDDLDKLVDAVRLARRAELIAQQNLTLSAILICVIVIAGVSGLLSLPAAALAQEITELAVSTNGLRMLRG